MTLVSVIIPTWNRADDAVRAVESALAQTVEDVEVIVADDGSTDGTRAVLDPLLAGDRMRYVRIEHSGLPAVVRNAGLRSARGEWVAFLDSDDAWLPHKLERQLASVVRAGADFACANALVERDGETGVACYHDRAGATGLRTLESIVKDNVVITSTVLVRRSRGEGAGWFSEDPRLRASEDFDLWLRLLCSTRILYDSEPLAVYRDASSSLRSAVSREQYHVSLLRIFTGLRRQRALAPSLARDVDARIEGLCGFLREDYECHLKGGEWSPARALLGELVRSAPMDLSTNGRLAAAFAVARLREAR